jgi:neutral amino acid transport system ATP-binding protein
MAAVHPLLGVFDLYAGYVPGLNILQGVNLEVFPDEIVAVIGPNGAGKSTLVKTLLGLLTPNQGSIQFENQTIVGLKPENIVALGLAYVPQLTNVFPSLTVEENLEMGAFLRSGALNPLKDRIYGLFPSLAQRRRQRAGTLSGGERQLLAMGKALILEPKLLILDEPSAALSPMLVNQVFEQIQQVNQTGTAIVLVEQNVRKALMVADRGYVLENGRDCFTGIGSELLNDPKIGQLYLGNKNADLRPKNA